MMLFRPGLPRIYFIGFTCFLPIFGRISFMFYCKEKDFFVCDFSDRFLLFIVQYENLYICSFFVILGLNIIINDVNY